MRKIICVVLAVALGLAGFAMAAFAQSSFVTYEQFGAVGDGVTCDFDAIIAAHNHANRNSLPVRARQNATYLIGESGRTATIQTNTYWGNAHFILDNYNMSHDLYVYNVFEVTSRLPAVDMADRIPSLSAGQENIGITLPQRSYVVVRDNGTRHFTRPGSNGAPMTSGIIVNADGSVDPETPIIWDFPNVTDFVVRPIDTQTLTITGGNIRTIEAHTGRSGPFVRRGIHILRSNVVIDGINHNVEEIPVPGDTTGRSHGIIQILEAANVTVRNGLLVGRVGYDIHIESSANITFYHMGQNNCIHDGRFWGMTGTHRNRNLVFDNVSFSRIGSHQGVHNLTIRNSEVGWSGIPTTGSGILLLENTTVSSWHLITLRELFGSGWNGEFIIRDVVFHPQSSDVALIYFANNGRNNFGFETHLPHTITIDGLVIDDAHMRWNGRPFPHIYTGPSLFTANHTYGNDALGVTLLWDYLTNRWRAPYAHNITQEVILNDVEVTSGRRLSISRSVLEIRPTLFSNIIITRSSSDA